MPGPVLWRSALAEDLKGDLLIGRDHWLQDDFEHTYLSGTSIELISA